MTTKIDVLIQGLEKLQIFNKLELAELRSLIFSFKVNSVLNKDLADEEELHFHLVFNAYPSIKLINTLKKINKYDRDFKFFWSVNCVTNINNLLLYLDDFFKSKNLPLLKVSLARENNFLLDTNKLIVKYCSNEEKNHWLKIQDEILIYLKDTCQILIQQINYELDEALILENEFKQKQLLNKSQQALQEQVKIEKQKLNKQPKYNKVANYHSKNQIISKISELELLQKYANIEGLVEWIKWEQLKNGSHLLTVLVSDDSSAIYLKAFVSADNVSDYASLQPGIKIKAKIELEINQYDIRQQLIGRLREWIILDDVNKIDDAPLKRIEFSIHTKMSSYDGLITPDDLYNTLNQYEHKYFGITDRSNVQMFPEILKKFEHTDIKPIYGVEIEMLEDNILAVVNEQHLKLKDANYVIFDLETTGLYPAFEDIIEFGAVKYVNGIRVQSEQFFIKPNHPISVHTQELTGISEADVKGAISQLDGLKRIIDFCGDAILIAHNGINFDINFLNYKLKEYGLNPLTNPLIDTMVISRAINNYVSNTLEKIAHKNKIEYQQSDAHRADYDADVLAKVWDVMLGQLESLKITYLDEINVCLNQSNLKASTRGNFVNLYAKNQKGIRDLYQLISIAHTDQYFNRPTLSRSTIDSFRENIFIANAVIESELIDTVINKHKDELEKKMTFYDFILIPSPAGLSHELKSHTLRLNDLENSLKTIITTAKLSNKLCIASGNVYYFNLEEKRYHDVFVNIPILNRKRHRFFKYKTGPDNFYRTTNEMKEEFNFLENTKLIDEIVVLNGYEIIKEIDFTLRPLQNKLFPPHIEGVNEKVRNKVYETAHKFYGLDLPEVVVNRIEKELNSIIGNGYAVVYWISHLLVEQSIKDGYVVGSRGSVGSSLVATFLTITDVNPLEPHYLCKHCKYSDFSVSHSVDDGYDLNDKECPHCHKQMNGEGHNIPFETFLGFKGDKVPDIDLNFSGVYQNKAHDFIKQMFGEDHAFRAGTISTIAEKTSFANVREYFENINETPTDAMIQQYALHCQDVKRTTGQHPGGIVVVPQDMSIFDFTPYNYPADDLTQDWKTTHFAFEYIHDNLLKFDILGHDNPTALKLLKDLTGIDEKDIPNHDPKTLSLFYDVAALNLQPDDVLGEKTGAISIPEFGTKFVREMLVDAQPKSFADLIRISGLSHGTDVWLGNAKDLIKNQNLTLEDVIGCRDDIMVYLINKGVDPSTSFKVMEDVRKGKGIKAEYKTILLEHNIPDWYLESANKIKYMFPKAHATAYVLHAWKFAWYKLYYPLEYYCSYFSVRSSAFDIKTMTSSYTELKETIKNIQKKLNNNKTKNEVSNKEKDLLPLYEVVLEMMARGYKIKKIDLNKSLATDFVLDKQENAIICPFSALDGLGDAVAESIINARNDKPFNSIEDLIKRTKITKQHIEKLKELHVLDDLSATDQISLFDF